MLVTKERDGEGAGAAEVTLERFGLMCKWFGPVKSRSSNILKTLVGTMQHGWFHGDIERDVRYIFHVAELTC